MEKLTYKNQHIVSIIIVIFCFILANLLKLGFLSNIGFVLSGILWILHPVSPASLAHFPKNKRKNIVRIGGAVLIVLGITIRFGV